MSSTTPSTPSTPSTPITPSTQPCAFRFGDDVDTDQIIPACYLLTGDPKELAVHCLEGADASFAERVRPGDVIVAGRNFGCGSSREHAPLAILGCGVQAVVAVSFARIFYRNSINLGLALLECPEAAVAIAAGAPLKVDVARGTIEDLLTGKTYQAAPAAPFALEVRAAGGLMAWVARRAGLDNPSGVGSA